MTDSSALIVQRIDDSDARIHLDIHTDDLDAEVDRVVALGATERRRFGQWVVLTDRRTRLLRRRRPPGTLTDDNANVWGSAGMMCGC
ncbi:MAG: VOC family protein [Ilumatobacteraceae bacterium]